MKLARQPNNSIPISALIVFVQESNMATNPPARAQPKPHAIRVYMEAIQYTCRVHVQILTDSRQ